MLVFSFPLFFSLDPFPFSHYTLVRTPAFNWLPRAGFRDEHGRPRLEDVLVGCEDRDRLNGDEDER